MKLIAILENPNYIMNIGNVIRNVNGLGVDKLYVIDGLKRLENDLELLRERKTLLKHSSGAIKFTEIIRFDTSQQCLESLKNDGFISVGTSPDKSYGKNYILEESNLKQENLAIWFGDEANGLTKEVLEQCEFNLTIEMRGKVESLNLATTTGIVMYEAIRQRKK